MILKNPREEYKNLPETPGVYKMKDATGRFLYIGKAGNLRRRVSSYFTRPHDARIERLVSEIETLEYEVTDTAIEALILEARLIKEEQPFYNIKEKDGKSFLFVEITDQEFPAVHLVRSGDTVQGERFGPFTSATSIRTAMRIIRKIFPYSVHGVLSSGKNRTPCFDYQIGLCPGVCVGAVSPKEYQKIVRGVRMLLSGKKRMLITTLEKEMKSASDAQRFEEAGELQKQLFALQHIRDVALIGDNNHGSPDSEQGVRIEGYDISHISGTSAVGSMVVFYGNEPVKREYRKFRIRTVEGSNDTAMLAEVISRRLQNEWPLPACIMVDGGVGQVHAVEEVLTRNGSAIPVVGIAKGPERKRNDVIGTIPLGIAVETLVKVRDEAHRFAITYHRKLRSVNAFKKEKPLT